MIDEDVLRAMDNDATRDLTGDDLMFAMEVTRLARIGLWAERWAIGSMKHYAQFLEDKCGLEKNGLQRAIEELDKTPDSTEH